MSHEFLQAPVLKKSKYSVDDLRNQYLEGEEEDVTFSENNRDELIRLIKEEKTKYENLKKDHKKQLDKLTKYFFVRKSNHLINSMNVFKNYESSNEERYVRYVKEHMKQRKELEETQQVHNKEFQELEKKLELKKQEVERLSDELLKYKIQIARDSENSRTGRKIDSNKIKEYAVLSQKKDELLRKIRTKYLLLLNKKESIDDSLKNKEFSNGLHLIDFEQYKMENAQLNDKIEEKNEALQKSKLKATETVHILTHVNEKLQFIQEKDVQLKKKLTNLEEKLKENKDYLTHLKKERDAFKSHNQHLRDTNPLIGNNALLEDYENRKKELEVLKKKLKNLQEVHSVHTFKTEKYKESINEIEKKLKKIENPSFKVKKGGLLPFF